MAEKNSKYNAELAPEAIIDCAEKKSGVGSTGRTWMLVPVKAQEGYNRMTLWVSNADDCVNARYVKVQKILKVVVSSRKKPDGTYYTDTNVNANCEPLSSNEPMGYDISDDPLKDLFG